MPHSGLLDCAGQRNGDEQCDVHANDNDNRNRNRNADRDAYFNGDRVVHALTGARKTPTGVQLRGSRA